MPRSATTRARWQPPRESPSRASTLGRADWTYDTADRPRHRRPGNQCRRRVPGRASDRFARLACRAAVCQRRLLLGRPALYATRRIPVGPVSDDTDGPHAGLAARLDVAAASGPLNRAPTLPSLAGGGAKMKTGPMDNVTLSRAIMGTSLGFHIVFAVLGVGMPLLMLVAEGIGLWRHDAAWRALARRWAKAFALIFAIGAVSGTALSFELGLLWPGFMAFSGSMIGLPFSAEGFAFFIEAIFLGLYLYGWERLSPLVHWLTGIPIAISGAASSLFVVMTNAWMNSPTGFVSAGNRIIRVDPLAAAFNPSTPTEDVHMLVSAYLVTGFAVAAVYATGFLRGHGDALHRRALPLAMAMAVVASGLAGITGDTSARFVAGDQPIKFASPEGLFPTTAGAPLHIGGLPLPDQNRMVLAIVIPHLLSWLVEGDPNATIKGLDAYPRDLWPNVLVVHLSFQIMVGLGLALGLCGLLYWLLAVRRRAPPTGRWLLLALMLAGPASVVAMETGWFVTEFGRQPWIIYGVMRTSAAATTTPALGPTFAIFLLVYIALGLTLTRLLLLLAQRERRRAAPTGAEPGR